MNSSINENDDNNDCIAKISDWLVSNNISYELDDFFTMYDGIDDVFVIYIDDVKYKFAQNLVDNKYSNFSLYCHNNDEFISINEYENVVNFLRNRLNI